MLLCKADAKRSKQLPLSRRCHGQKLTEVAPVVEESATKEEGADDDNSFMAVLRDGRL